MASALVTLVGVMDSIVNKRISGLCTVGTSGCSGQYCQ